MEENKQETIARLYALRAGLSIMSEIQDEARIVKNSIESSERHIRELIEKQNQARERGQKEKVKAQTTAQKEQEEYLKKLKEYQTIASQKRQAVAMLESKIAMLNSKEENYLRKQKSAPIRIFFLSLLCLILLVSIPIVLFFLIPALRSDFIDDKRRLATTQEELAKTRNELIVSQTELNKLMANAANKEANKVTALATIKEKSDKIVADTDQQIRSFAEETSCQIQAFEKNISQSGAKLKLIIERFKSAYQATQDQFCPFVDERDWENVDLIIFNYETGRALDLRDALIQVDNERRNERLIEAVHYASAAICSRIYRGFGELENTFKHHMHMLEERIENLSFQIKEDTDRQIEAITESSKAERVLLENTSRQIDTITKNSFVQQALINKSNISSDTMAEDVRYMRQLAEINYYHR